MCFKWAYFIPVKVLLTQKLASTNSQAQKVPIKIIVVPIPWLVFEYFCCLVCFWC